MKPSKLVEDWWDWAEDATGERGMIWPEGSPKIRDKILVLLKAIETADGDQLFEEYIESHGENVLPILHAALALKEKED